MSGTTVGMTNTFGQSNMKLCGCCGVMTTVTCVKGACVGCHGMGLCGHK